MGDISVFLCVFLVGGSLSARHSFLRDEEDRNGIATTLSLNKGATMWTHNQRQSLQAVQASLSSLEDRMSGIEMTLTQRLSPRLELGLEELGRRLESIDSRMTRTDALLDLRLEKMSESISSQQLTDDVMSDTLGRKLENVYERLSHKTGYLDTRIDLILSKFEAKMLTKFSEVQKSLEITKEESQKSKIQLDQIQRSMQLTMPQISNIQMGIDNCNSITGLIEDITGTTETLIQDLKQSGSANAETILQKIDGSLDRLRELELEFEEMQNEVRHLTEETQTQLHGVTSTMQTLQLVLMGKDVEQTSSFENNSISTLFQNLKNKVTKQDASIVALQDTLSTMGNAHLEHMMQLDSTVQKLVNKSLPTVITTNENTQISTHNLLHSINKEIHNLQNLMHNRSYQNEQCKNIQQSSPSNDDVNEQNDKINPTLLQYHLQNITWLIQEKSKESEIKLSDGIISEAKNIGNKLSNMYNDLWRNSLSTESQIRDTIAIMNNTRRDIQEALFKIVQVNKRITYPGDGFDQSLENLALIFKRKLTELSQKLESNFEMLLSAQNTFLNSCHRIQLNEPQLELKISHVLDKMLQTFLNRTQSTNSEVQHFHQTLASHGEDMTNAVTNLGEALMELSVQTSNNYQLLIASLPEILNAHHEGENQEEKFNEILDKIEQIHHSISNGIAVIDFTIDKVSKDFMASIKTDILNTFETFAILRSGFDTNFTIYSTKDLTALYEIGQPVVYNRRLTDADYVQNSNDTISTQTYDSKNHNISNNLRYEAMSQKNSNVPTLIRPISSTSNISRESQFNISSDVEFSHMINTTKHYSQTPLLIESLPTVNNDLPSNNTNEFESVILNKLLQIRRDKLSYNKPIDRYGEEESTDRVINSTSITKNTKHYSDKQNEHTQHIDHDNLEKQSKSLIDNVIPEPTISTLRTTNSTVSKADNINIESNKIIADNSNEYGNTTILSAQAFVQTHYEPNIKQNQTSKSSTREKIKHNNKQSYLERVTEGIKITEKVKPSNSDRDDYYYYDYIDEESKQDAGVRNGSLNTPPTLGDIK